MKHLVIFAHPYQQSLNKAMLERVIAASQQVGTQVIVRDLYALQFQPILSWEELNASFQGITPEEVRYEQKLIAEADLITLIYPLWWMGFPAILKGYLDRVLSFGFAYETVDGVSRGLLTGKKMQHFITMGSGNEKYQQAGFDSSLKDCLVDGLFNFCGITDIQHRLFGDIYLQTEQGIADLLQEVEQKTVENLTAL